MGNRLFQGKAAFNLHKAELTVQRNERIARQIYQMVLHGPMASSIQAPGQFVHIRCGDGWETLLRRPISIASWDQANETISIIYRAEGQGTRWLSKRDVGERIDVLGPLGNGFPITVQPSQKVLLVGGGVGVPPLYGLAQTLQKNGVKVDTVLGFASRDDVFLMEAFRQYGTVKVATDDGTFGHNGLVTDLIKDNHAWDAFYACGPTPMLRALQTLFDGTHVKGYVSLEQRMGCGIGACLACVCPTDTGEQVKICSDGPVFRYEEVVL